MSPQPNRVTLCLFCFKPTMQLSYDKKNRAFLRCALCASTVFSRSGDMAVVGYGLAVRAVMARAPSLRDEYAANVQQILKGTFGAGDPLPVQPDSIPAPTVQHAPAG